MIIFSGQLSGKCKEDVLRRGLKISFIGGLITSIILGIPTVILAFKIHWIISLFIPFFILLPFLAACPPNKKVYSSIFPTKITIDLKTGIITSQSDKFHVTSSVDEVVRVIDMGEWYHIYVKNKEGRFICQKNLLYSGTLDEFEEFFKNKIIK